MAFSIYSGRRRWNEKPLMVLITMNACFAASVLFAWTLVCVFIAEPIAWATWAPLSIGSQPDLLDYPFVLLWAMPLGGICAAWIFKNFYEVKWAYFSATLPIMLLCVIFTYFYFVPIEYH